MHMPRYSSRRRASRLASAVTSFALLAGGAAVTSGCPSPAVEPALQAAAALDHCDLRTATERFATAHHADPHHPQAALGFALTDLVTLPESPASTAILHELGFTGPVDMNAVLFGTNGLLARLARNDRCTDVTAHLRATIPYAPLFDSSVRPATLIRADLTGEQLRPHVTALVPRLRDEAAALETAANGMEGNSYEINGSGCGQTQPIALQRPELLGAAAVLEALRAGLEVGLAYDWDLPLRMLLESDPSNRDALAAQLNAHLFHLRDAAAVGAARATMRRSFDLAIQAIDAAKQAPGGVPNALVDWSALPDARLDDLRRLAASVEQSLEAPTALADVSPAVTLDLRHAFDNPPDAARLSGPLFTVQTSMDGGESYSYLTTVPERWRELLDQTGAPTALVMPAPGSTAPAWTPMEAWRTVMADPIVSPLRRFDGLHCAP